MEIIPIKNKDFFQKVVVILIMLYTQIGGLIKINMRTIQKKNNI